MDQRTQDALAASIEKWEQNVRAETPKDVKLGTSNCPLCQLFFEINCQGCPVLDRTGFVGCNNTPYDNVAYARLAWFDHQSAANAEAFRAAAQAEVDFLKSLVQS